jgi:hypothetical protein
MSDCPICFESLKNEFVCRTPCGHEFCLKCILDLKQNNCPICRGLYTNKLPLKLKGIWYQNDRDVSRRNRSSFFNEEDFPPLGN